jgi:hypothetical protein
MAAFYLSYSSKIVFMGIFDKLFGTTKIRVQFIDNATGDTIGIAEMSPDQLPETFSVATKMQIQADQWEVEEAIPEQAADFIKTKELVLKMRKLEMIDPANILYTLPTIANELPAYTDIARFNDFKTQLQEDDWRQNEFFVPEALPQIENEVAKVKEIWDNYSEEVKDQPFTAFSKCHPRDTGTVQELSITLEQLKSLLNTNETGSVAINDQWVAHGFSLRTKDSTYYGLLTGDQVSRLCISEFTDKTIEEILSINNAFNLHFISWYHCDVVTIEA